MQARSVANFIPTTLAVCCLFALVLPQTVAAQDKAQASQAIAYRIEPGTLDSALNKFATQSKLQVVYSPELVAGKTSAGLSGQHSPQQALELLLKDKAILWDAVSHSMYVLRAGKKASRTSKSNEGRAPASEDQSKTESIETKDLADVVVVGSRLGSSPVESAMPIKVITRDDLDRSGAGNIAQALSYLSEVSVNNNVDRAMYSDGVGGGGNANATTVQLRGMPPGTVLILINGRRAGASASYSDTGEFNLSTIPLALVERIEVLPAGASAVYGGDGLSGVINIVLRRDANGVEARYRRLAVDGYKSQQASTMFGKSWGKGEISVAATWSKETDLLSSRREITRDQDYRRFGGLDLRAGYANPATVYSLEGCSGTDYCFIPIANRGNLPGLNSPFAVVPAGSDGTGLTTGSFLGTQGVLGSSSNLRHLNSAETKYAVASNLRIELSDKLELFADGAYTKRSVPAYQLSLFSSGAEYSEPRSILPASNPYNPFGVPVAVGYRFDNTGAFTNFDQSHIRILAGLRGTLSRVEWEVSASRSNDKSYASGAQFVSDEALVASLASTDPATAFNPFVSNGGLPLSGELFSALIGESYFQSKSVNDSFLAHVRSSVLKLPAGNLTGLLGIEANKTTYEMSSDSSDMLFGGTSGSEKRKAAFAEVRVPIVAPGEGQRFERLVATGAYRRETGDSYTQPASTSALGLEYRPTQSLLLRGTYSTAVRPLQIYYGIQDPRFMTQYVVDPVLDNMELYVPVLYTGGMPADLLPERSNNTTLGMLYRPSTGTSFGLTHWQMNFRDRISYISTYDIVLNEAIYPGRVIRDPETRVITQVDGRQVNIAMMSASGVDIDMSSVWQAARGDINASLAATYTYKHEEQLAPGQPIQNGVAVHRFQSWAPRWKVIPRVMWNSRGSWDAAITGRYVSRYRDSQPITAGENAGSYQWLGAFWMFDVNATIRLDSMFEDTPALRGSQISLGATNIFDRLPDFCAGCSATGYDASQYDIIGRSLYAELRVSF